MADASTGLTLFLRKPMSTVRQHYYSDIEEVNWKDRKINRDTFGVLSNLQKSNKRQNLACQEENKRAAKTKGTSAAPLFESLKFLLYMTVPE